MKKLSTENIRQYQVLKGAVEKQRLNCDPDLNNWSLKSDTGLSSVWGYLCVNL